MKTKEISQQTTQILIIKTLAQPLSTQNSKIMNKWTEYGTVVTLPIGSPSTKSQQPGSKHSIESNTKDAKGNWI